MTVDFFWVFIHDIPPILQSAVWPAVTAPVKAPISFTHYRPAGRHTLDFQLHAFENKKIHDKRISSWASGYSITYSWLVLLRLKEAYRKDSSERRKHNMPTTL